MKVTVKSKTASKLVHSLGSYKEIDRYTNTVDFVYSNLCSLSPPTNKGLLYLGWTGVATWRWIANDDNCGICRMPFDSCCPDCKLPGDDCPLVWGACSHCFHIHCIVKWLHSQPQQQCPMCRQDWKFNNK